MKIIISSNTSWNIYNFRLNLIKYLLNKNIKVILIAPKDNYTEKIVKMGCEFYNISYKRSGILPFNELKIFFIYLFFIKKIKPDFYLGFTIKPNIYGSLASRMFGVKVINNISGLGTVFIRGGLIKKITILLYKLSLKKSYKILFQNKDDFSLFLNHGIVKKHQSLVIPGSGVDLDFFNKKFFDEADTKKLNFLFIGRLIKDKGINEFVEVAKKIKIHYSNVQFSILGSYDFENRTSIKKNILDEWIRSKAIQYYGFKDDVRPYISNASCIVLPSYREGVPKTLIEAAAMGKPIIATDVPGCRDIVEDNYNGFLCKVKNSESLENCILKFINLKETSRKKMSFNSRNKAIKEFDDKIIIKKYLELINVN